MKLRSSMTALSLVLPMLLALATPASVWAASHDTAPAVAEPAAGLQRFMVVRTFPAGALAGLDAAGEKRVNMTNAKSRVNWVHSYTNAEKTKTFCIYEGPNEQSIRDAADASKIPVDYIVPIPKVIGLGAHQ